MSTILRPAPPVKPRLAQVLALEGLIHRLEFELGAAGGWLQDLELNRLAPSPEAAEAERLRARFTELLRRANRALRRLTRRPESRAAA